MLPPKVKRDVVACICSPQHGSECCTGNRNLKRRGKEGEKESLFFRFRYCYIHAKCELTTKYVSLEHTNRVLHAR